MDIRMPGVDGLEATRRISADEDLAGVKVVILAPSWSSSPTRAGW
jgi:CheY-like chemotaxis protein